MIIRTRTVATTATATRRCVSVSVTWRCLFSGTGRVSFSPQLLKKNQTSISQDIEEKILSMYAKGMTTGDIEAYIRDNLWGRGL